MRQSILVNRILLSLTLGLSAIGGSAISAQAESASGAVTSPSHLVSTEGTTPTGQESAPTTDQPAATSEQTSTGVPTGEAETEAKPSVITLPQINPSPVDRPTQLNVGQVPVPGTTSTSTNGLQAQTPDAPAPETTPVAVETRYKFSYVGFGVNLGAGSGDTALGEVAFAAFSKFAISPDFSFRPAILVSNDVSFLLPFTYDFVNRGPGTISPFIGVGPVFSTGRSDNVDLLLTAGLDYPLNPQLAVTGSVNVAPLNKFDIGFILGLAYTFGTETITTPQRSLSELIPNQPPRPNPSYFGGGVNFGGGGNAALGRISGAIYSKIALGPSYSFRPAILISKDVSFLLPVTYDFRVVRLSDYVRLAPYAGLGAIISSGQDDAVGLLLTGGVDVPLSDQFAATLGLNIAPFNEFSIGFKLGVAYTFGKFE